MASAAVAGLAAAAIAFQNLWQQGTAAFAESRETVGVLPLILLGGVAGLVALAIAALVLRNLGRLLLASRMTVALLSGVALICVAGLVFDPEPPGTGREASGAHNENALARRIEPLLGPEHAPKAADKLLVLARTAGLTDLPRSWALHALLGMLALASAAALVWRRPVGAREFGFLGTHLGVLLIMGGVAAGGAFGYHRSGLKLGLDQTAQNVPAGPADRAAFSVVAREIHVEHGPPRYRVLAWSGQEKPVELELDGAGPGSRARWRDLDVEVIDFRPDTLAEAHVVDSGDGVRNPAVRVALSAAGGTHEFVLEAFGGGWLAAPDLGAELRFDRIPTGAEAEEFCRRWREGEAETLQVTHPDGGTADEAQLEFGHDKVNETVHLNRLGVALRVLRWFSAARPGGPSGPVRVMPGKGTFPAMQLQPAGEVAGVTPPAFWVLGGNEPSRPVGEVPDALAGLLWRYNPPVWQALSLRVVEGPPGTFRLAELVDGRLARVRELPMGGALDVDGGRRLELRQFLRGARLEYRPGKPAPGRGPEPAVRLAVSRGDAAEEFWYFPARSQPRELFGGFLAVRALPGHLARQAVTLEIQEGGEPRRFTVESGRPLRHKGYTVGLTGMSGVERRDGRTVGLVELDVTRRPGVWAACAGMLLLALGAPWLLWSRFRHVPDPAAEER